MQRIGSQEQISTQRQKTPYDFKDIVEKARQGTDGTASGLALFANRAFNQISQASQQLFPTSRAKWLGQFALALFANEAFNQISQTEPQLFPTSRAKWLGQFALAARIPYKNLADFAHAASINVPYDLGQFATGAGHMSPDSYANFAKLTNVRTNTELPGIEEIHNLANFALGTGISAQSLALFANRVMPKKNIAGFGEFAKIAIGSNNRNNLISFAKTIQITEESIPIFASAAGINGTNDFTTLVKIQNPNADEPKCTVM